MQTLNANEKILLVLHGLLRKNRLFDLLVLWCARYLIFVTAVFFVIMLCLERPDAIFYFLTQLAIALVVALGLSYVVAFFFKMVRPCERKDVKALFFPLNHWKSFPSDHTLIMFVLAGTAAFAQLPFVSLFLIVLGGVVGVSRVIAGVHYPADIVGGALLGWFVSVVVGMIGQWLFV